MPKARKRVNDGDDDINQLRPKKKKVDQVDVLFNSEDEACDSENDPGRTASQKFLALTRKKVVAKSNEVLVNFRDVLESRKKASWGVLSNHANKIKEKEYELRKATLTILDAISPNDAGVYMMKDSRPNSAFILSHPLKETSQSNISRSKAFLQQYRRLSQEMASTREEIHTGSGPKENIKYMQSLLDKRSGRLRAEIYAILRDEDLADEIESEDKVEKELWSRFGAVNTVLKPVEDDAWRRGEAWAESTKNSQRALRRLVKYLPKEL